MSVNIKISHDENKYLSELKIDSPRCDIGVSDVLSSSADIFISRYDTLINLKYLKENINAHIIGMSPTVKEEVNDIITLLNKKEENNLRFRTSATQKSSTKIKTVDDFDNCEKNHFIHNKINWGFVAIIEQLFI